MGIINDSVRAAEAMAFAMTEELRAENARLLAERDALLIGVETATRILREIAEASDGDYEDVEELEALIASVKAAFQPAGVTPNVELTGRASAACEGPR